MFLLPYTIKDRDRFKCLAEAKATQQECDEINDHDFSECCLTEYAQEECNAVNDQDLLECFSIEKSQEECNAMRDHDFLECCSIEDIQQECDTMNDHDFLEPPIIESMPITSLENDLKICKSWKNKQVFLWDEIRIQMRHKGFILYVFPDNCVNF